MERGDFYATTGVELNDVSFQNNILEIQVNPAEGITYTIQFWGAKKNEEKGGQLLKEIKGVSGMYKFRENDLYVRAKIISTRLKENPYQRGDLETAWTQPVRSN
jgi:hypothetical protein